MTRKYEAFTVIELLVVIGIIGVLAALLLAVFGPARESARKASCISNLHQIATALAMYRADYDGSEAAVGNEVPFYGLGVPAAGAMFVSFSKTYIKNKDVLFCPDLHQLYANDPRPLRRESMTTSYSWLVPPEDDGLPPQARFGHRAALKGENTVISDCLYHNPMIDLRTAPRWTVRTVNFLRLSGQVEARQVPFNSTNNDW